LERLLLVYDELLGHRLSKRVRRMEGPAITAMLEDAGRLRAQIPDEWVDCDQAKAAVMARTEL